MDEKNQWFFLVQIVCYKVFEENLVCGLVCSYVEYVECGWLVVWGCWVLCNQYGYMLDLIFGYFGWGEMLFLCEIWFEVKLLVYVELMYCMCGQDVGFDFEVVFDSDEGCVIMLVCLVYLIQGLVQVDVGLVFMCYQVDSFFFELCQKLMVIYDGIDIDVVKFDLQVWLELFDGCVLMVQDEVISYVLCLLELYCGFYCFMWVLFVVMCVWFDVQVVLIGGDGVSYGGQFVDVLSWKVKMLVELDGQFDLLCFYFLGCVFYVQYLLFLQIVWVYCYLIYFFVFSWFLIEVMVVGCQIVVLDIELVCELVWDGENGWLVLFFDQFVLEVVLICVLLGDLQVQCMWVEVWCIIVDVYDLKC